MNMDSLLSSVEQSVAYLKGYYDGFVADEPDSTSPNSSYWQGYEDGAVDMDFADSDDEWEKLSDEALEAYGAAVAKLKNLKQRMYRQKVKEALNGRTEA